MGRSDTGATTGWTEGKPYGKERYGSNERVDGKETVANSLGSSEGNDRHESDERVDGREIVGSSLGRAPTRGWTDGKPWEIAWGELRWEEATY